ncbi:MAG: UxaA family hydrolase [Balneolaceae bacterium]
MSDFLLHDENDTVGVVVADVEQHQAVKGRTLAGKDVPQLKSLSNISLGHKIAIQDFEPGDTVIKYGVDIGKVVKSIKTGEHVHTHNLKTKRW